MDLTTVGFIFLFGQVVKRQTSIGNRESAIAPKLRGSAINSESQIKELRTQNSELNNY
jgi:hypothetical protein